MVFCVHHFHHVSDFFPCFSTFFPLGFAASNPFSMGKAARQRRLQWFIGLDVASRVGLPGRARWWNWGNFGKKGVLRWFCHGLTMVYIGNGEEFVVYTTDASNIL